MPSTINIGLVGYGGWARKSYVPALFYDSAIDIMAVAARTDETLAAARRDLGTGIVLFKDYRELLNHPGIDAVMIGTTLPINTHIGIASLKARKHVWIEPPFANVKESEDLFELAMRSDKIFHTNLELRYLPVVDVIHELINPGPLGQLQSVRVELKNDWGSTQKFNRHIGAAVAGLSTWYLDVIDAFFNDLPLTIDFHGDDQMKTWSAVLKYRGDKTGELALDLTGSDWQTRIEIECEAGKAEANLIEGTYGYSIRNGATVSGKADCIRPKCGFEGVQESVIKFLSAVRGTSETQSGPVTYQRLHKILMEFEKQSTLD